MNVIHVYIRCISLIIYCDNRECDIGLLLILLMFLCVICYFIYWYTLCNQNFHECVEWTINLCLCLCLCLCTRTKLVKISLGIKMLHFLLGEVYHHLILDYYFFNLLLFNKPALTCVILLTFGPARGFYGIWRKQPSSWPSVIKNGGRLLCWRSTDINKVNSDLCT